MLAFNSHIPLRQSHPPQHSFLWISCRCSPFIMLKSILSIRTKFSPNDCHSCQHGHHCSVVWAQTHDAFSPQCFHSPRGRLHVPTGRLSSSLLAYNLAHTTEGELLGFLAPIPSLPQSLIRDHPTNLPMCLKAKRFLHLVSPASYLWSRSHLLLLLPVPAPWNSLCPCLPLFPSWLDPLSTWTGSSFLDS